MPGGLPLVQSSTALQLKAVPKGDDLSLQVEVGTTSFEVEGKNLGGKFRGLLELRDEFIPGLKKDLDLTAYEIVQKVNNLHEAGTGMDGSTGVPFFNNPGNHVSQEYPAPDLATAFTSGSISLEVAGVTTVIGFDATAGGSLEDLATAINNSGAAVSASVDQLDDGNYVLTVLPSNHNSSINFDMGDIGGDYAKPRFTMTNMSQLMSMSVQDPVKVAAGNSSAPGDNTNALAISALKDQNAVNDEDTFVSFYGKMTARVGIEAGQNRLSQSGAEDSLTQLKNMRDGAVGVSLEEEMISLIKFQRGFEASAKLLSTVDEMMGTVMNIRR